MKRGIDHLVLCVNDLEPAAAFYRQLGFTTTPRARHPWGTDNCLIQLTGAFIELLTVSRPSLISAASPETFSFGAFNQQFLTRREGMSMLVFESKDVEADREEFMARGLPPYDKFYFERQAKLPDGSLVPVAFSLAFATDPRMPQAAFFCCQQHAPQYFWKSEYQSHANGADEILDVIMVAESPESLSGFFFKLQESDSVVIEGARLTVHTPRGTIIVLNPAEACRRYGAIDLSNLSDSPYFLGFSVHVGELDRVADNLHKNRIPCKHTKQSIQVKPQDAFGVMVEFRK